MEAPRPLIQCPYEAHKIRWYRWYRHLNECYKKHRDRPQPEVFIKARNEMIIQRMKLNVDYITQQDSPYIVTIDNSPLSCLTHGVINCQNADTCKWD